MRATSPTVTRVGIFVVRLPSRPRSVSIADCRPQRRYERAELLREVLVLTKMNWNSANMFGLMPITLRFSRLVGDVLREVPEDQKPKTKYKFYM